MTTKYSTKKALISSIFALIMCFSMLLGTTFAWFTDSVTSANNIIASGNLDVALHWADGTKTVPAKGSADWTDASKTAIFDYELWEPGYVQVRHVKISNEGTLALKYQVQIVANGEVSDLADVIDVYYVDPAVQVADRAALANTPKLGTLTEVLENLGDTGNGTLEAGEADTITIALKMQEDADNKYQNLSIGSDFSVIVLATQLASEDDSFDNQYDKDAKYPWVDSVTIDMDTATVASGATVTLAATATPENAINKKVTWTSSNTDVATVDENGVVTGVALGTATITATAGDFSDSCEVTVYKDFVRKLNRGHNENSSISTSTGSDFLPIVAVNPTIKGYSVFDGDTRITDAVVFRFSDVKKEAIDENSYKVSLDLAVLDSNGKDLVLKPNSNSNGKKEYLNVFLNLIELPEGYSIADVKVNGVSFTLTQNAGGDPFTGEYWIGSDGNDVYLQSMEAGLIEVIVAKTN